MTTGSLTKYAELLYNPESEPIIIAVTGLTGSGCSTIAKIMRKNEHPELPEDYLFKSTATSPQDEYAYKKLKRNWLSIVNKGWQPFTTIHVSSVILYHLLLDLNRRNKYKYSEDDYDHDIIDEVIELSSSISDFPINKDGDSTKIIDTLKEIDKIKQKLKAKFQAAPKLTVFFQDVADNIRKYGYAIRIKSDKHDCRALYALPKTIEIIITAYRKKDANARFVLDALRNPFEIDYFNSRIPNFYVIGIHRKNELREKWLNDNYGTHDDRVALEDRENGTRIKNRTRDNIPDWITSQDLISCLGKSDMHIWNKVDHKNFHFLNYGLIKLLTLVARPGCVTPTQDERCMQIALTIKKASGCISRQVGAIIIDGKTRHIIGAGWNDPPMGQTPCALRTCEQLYEAGIHEEHFSSFEKSDEFTDWIRKLNTPYEPYCFRTELADFNDSKSNKNRNGDKIYKKDVYTRALHAEENAIFQALKVRNDNLENCTLYTTDSPCPLCAKKAYHLGISRIVFITEYEGIARPHSIESGVKKKLIDWHRFFGVMGSAYIRLYSQPIPEKDIIKIYI